MQRADHGERSLRRPPGGRAAGRRGALRRLGFWATGLLLLALVTAPFWGVRIAGVRHWLIDLAGAQAGMQADSRLRVEHVGSLNPFHVALRGLRLEARTESGDWRTVARAQRFAARWAPEDLLRGRLRFRAIAIDSLWIARRAVAGRGGVGETRDRLWPALPDSAGAQEAGALLRGLLPPFSIGALEVAPILVASDSGAAIAGGLRLAELESSDLGLFGAIRGGELLWPETDRALRLRDGELYAGYDGFFELRNLDLEAADSRARVTARFDPAMPASPVRVDVSLERLGERATAAWLPQIAIGAPGDSLRGALEAWIGPDRALFDLALAGRVRGEELTGLTAFVQVNPDTIRLAEIDLVAQNMSLAGDAHWARRTQTGRAWLEWRALDLGSRWLPWLHALPLGRVAAGQGHASLVLAEDGGPRIAGEVHLRDAQPWGVSLETLDFSGEVAVGRHVRARRARAVIAGGSLEASGTWSWDRPGTGVAARLDSFPLASLPSAWRAETTGRLSGRVRVTGEGLRPQIEAQLTGTGLGRRAWRCDTLAVDSLHWAVDRPRGGVRLAWSGLHRATPTGEGGAEPSVAGRAEVRRTPAGYAGDVSAQRGALALAARGALDPAGQARLEHLELRVPHLGLWELIAPFGMRWGEGHLETDSLHFAGPAGRLRGRVAWNEQADRIVAGLSGEEIALSGFNAWLAGPDSVRGRCSFDLLAEGRSADPLTSLRLRGEALAWGAIEIGDLTLAADWIGETLTLGPVELTGKTHALQVPEILWVPGVPLLEVLGVSVGGETVGSALRPRAELAAQEGIAPDESPLWERPWIGLIELQRIDLEALSRWAGLTLNPTGTTPAMAQSTLRVAGRRVPVHIVTPWEPEPTAAGDAAGGALSGTLTLGGSPRDPSLRLEAAAPGLRLARTRLGDLDFAATYSDSLIRIERLQLTQGGSVSWARGFYPLALSLVPPAMAPTDAAVRIRTELDAFNLELLSQLSRWLPDAHGALSGRLALEGSGRHPQLQGTLSLTGGGFRIPERSERVYDAEALVAVGPEGIQIRSLDARTGPHGRVAAVGTFAGPDAFDLSLVVSRARIWEAGRYEFTANADLNAYSAPERGGSVPHIDGVVEVLAGTITQELAEPTPGVGGEAQLPWVVDLDVEARGNVHVSQINAKADLGEGELHLTYRQPHWNASGTLNILGGTYRLLNNTFTIQGGTVEFRDTGLGPDMSVAVEAQTHIAVASEDEGPVENVTVTVDVHGELEELQIELSSAPPLSEEQIVELLSYGRFTRTGRFEATAETQRYLLTTMVDRIEASLIAQSPLFSRVGIQPGSTQEDPLRLSWRPIVTPAFLVNYTQDLALDPELDLSFLYRLSRVLFLRAALARDRSGAGGFSDEYSLDLKCRFEYE